MDCPDRTFLRCAWPAACKQRARRVVVLRFHEELGKRRMRLVSAAVIQANLGIAGQLEGSFAAAMVDDRHDPNFGVDIWRDTNCPRDFDVFGATEEIGPVPMKGVLVD